MRNDPETLITMVPTGNRQRVTYVEVHFPSPPLEKVVLIDMPGIGADECGTIRSGWIETTI
jgi:hypothetical protein